jgi:hypothetical protein
MTSSMARDFDFTLEQRDRLSDAYARRLMQTARDYEEQAQSFAEYAIESIWLSMGGQGPRFTPELAEELGNRALPAIPGVRELLDGFLEDAEPILPQEAMARLREEMEKPHRVLDRFEEKMQRWADGQMQEGEDPFSDLDDAPPPAAQEAGAQSPRPAEVQRAEQIADWTLSSIGAAQWASFLAQVKEYFKFDEQQSATADQILADYRAKAEAIMTPEWQQAVRENRVKVNLRHRLTGLPTIPWMWRLQYEYDQAQKPIHELGWSFRKEILALLTSQQREAAVSDIAPRAAEHGWSLDEQDKEVLGVSGSTWTLWKF